MGTARLISMIALLCGLAAPAAAGAQLTTSTGHLTFNPVRFGRTSAPQALSIGNGATATEPLVFTARLEGAAIGSFHLACPQPTCTCADDVCTGTRAPGESTVLEVTFTPPSLAQVNAQLRLATNDPLSPMRGISLQGIPVAPQATVTSPASLAFDFGPVALGSDGWFAPMMLRNTGNATMSIDSVRLAGSDPGEFRIVDGFTGAQLLSPVFPSNASRTWTVTCHPSSLGDKHAVLRIAHDALLPGSTTDIALSCFASWPDVVVSPPGPIDFGAVRIGTEAAPVSVDVSNQATAVAPLGFTARIVGEDAAFFTLACAQALGCACEGGACAAARVMPGVTVPLAVGFIAGLPARQRHAVLFLESDDPDGPVVVELIATAGRPRATLVAPLPGAPPVDGGLLDFGEVRNHDTSAPQLVTVENPGDVPLGIAAVTGSHPDAFEVAGPAAVTIAPGASESWSVTCAPEVRGAHDGTLRITSDDLDHPTVDVALRCTSVEAAFAIVSADPLGVGPGDTIDFGGTPVGGARSALVTVANTGNGAGLIGALQLASPQAGFSAGGLTANLVGPGMTASFVLTFAPTENGQGTTLFTIETDWNDPTATLTGTALATGVRVRPSPIDLGDVAWDRTADAVVAITNFGVFPFTVTGASLGGADAGELELLGFAPSFLGGFDTHTHLTLRARPNDAALGLRQAMLTVTTTLPGPGAMVQAPVLYRSVGPEVSLAPGPAIEFGDVDVDDDDGRTIELVLTNEGGGALVVTGISAPGGGFTRLAPPPGVVAANGGTLTVPITFRPATVGIAEATFTIDTTGRFEHGLRAPDAIEIVVRGRGIDRHLDVADVTFPDTYRDPTDLQVPIDTCGATGDRPCALTICNTGAAPLRVSMLIDPDDEFVLASSAPLAVAGGSPEAPSCEAVAIAFRPARAGDATGTVTVVGDDDGRPMAEVRLRGRGVLRPVTVTPGSIAPVAVPRGAPLRLSDLVGEGIVLASTSERSPATDTFEVRLQVTDDDPDRERAALVGDARPLPPMESATYDVAIDTGEPGAFTVAIDVFLDGDDEPQATVAIPVEVVADAGGCGCRTTGTGGGWPALLALLLLRRRPPKTTKAPAFWRRPRPSTAAQPRRRLTGGG